jgi:Skp family chaperone for outer membrane proteins
MRIFFFAVLLGLLPISASADPASDAAAQSAAMHSEQRFQKFEEHKKKLEQKNADGIKSTETKISKLEHDLQTEQDRLTKLKNEKSCLEAASTNDQLRVCGQY